MPQKLTKAQKATRVDTTGSQQGSRTAAQARVDRAAHTEGPWHVSTIDPTVVGPYRILSVPALEATCPQQLAVAHVLNRMEETAPNARLIAAAPELLDALRAFCGDYECTPLPIPEIQAAYKHALTIIDKAIGVNSEATKS